MANFNRFISGYDICKRALRVIGVPVPVSISGATDATSIQVWALLTELGQELLGAFEWSMKTRTFTITTDPLVKVYDLPEDLSGFISATAWNNTSRLPMQGPMTAQQWALLVARNLGGTTITLQYRINNNQLELYYSPSEPATVSIQYISRGWVQDGGDPAILKDEMVADGDICLFDPRLMVAMLRWRWRRAKGFDTTDLEEEYNIALENAKNADVPGQDLDLSYPGSSSNYLGYKNIPDTGYGQS